MSTYSTKKTQHCSRKGVIHRRHGSDRESKNYYEHYTCTCMCADEQVFLEKSACYISLADFVKKKSDCGL